MPTGNAPSHVCYLGVSQALLPAMPRASILLSFSLLMARLEPDLPSPPHLYKWKDRSFRNIKVVYQPRPRPPHPRCKLRGHPGGPGKGVEGTAEVGWR